MISDRVIAFDPGFDRLGVAIIERINGKDTLLYSTCITTDKKTVFQDRLLFLGNQVEKLIQEWNPGSAAMEELYYAKNVSTALPVAEVRGMITFLLGKATIPLKSYNPMTVKMSVAGHGGASKDDVHRMVMRLVTLDDRKRLDDEIDAVAVGLCHTAHSRYPQA